MFEIFIFLAKKLASKLVFGFTEKFGKIKIKTL